MAGQTGALAKAVQVILPKGKVKAKGSAQTATFRVDQKGKVLTAPDYRQHLKDIFTERSANDSRDLIETLLIEDPDMSAALNSYLTVANTQMLVKVVDENGVIDREGHKNLNMLVAGMNQRNDYTTGFEMTRNLRSICADFRYMLLKRGAIATELIFDKLLVPQTFRNIDPKQLEWIEKEPGSYKPQQKVEGSDKPIKLDIPTFFVSFYRKDPNKIYSYSPFVSAINTIAARQQVINDLYRIMQLLGYPRLEIKVLEEVMLKNAPENVKQDSDELNKWLSQRLTEINSQIANIRPDQAFTHYDSIETKIMNEKSAANALDISKVIEVLNAQNQAGLKTMAVIIGRGESGQNTGSTEARIFSMNAQELNEPIADILSRAFTFMLRLTGSVSTVQVRFAGVELRPDLELEPQLTMKGARLKEDLSLGLIGDDEYHLAMHGRLRPDSAPELSGTNFMQSSQVGVDAESVSPNSDPLGRSITPKGTKSAKSKTVKKT